MSRADRARPSPSHVVATLALPTLLPQVSLSVRFKGQAADLADTPLFLGLAGLAGLGGYVYLQRNPSIGAKAKSELHDAKDQAKSKFEDVKGDAKAKLDQVKGEAKAATATASTAAAGALVK